MDWPGFVVNSLAAIGSVAAAIAALYIATRDRKDRRPELDAADEAQARLVQIEVKQVHDLPDFDVEIHNYGDRAIIGAAVTEAWFFGRPDYRSNINHDREKIVRPEREAPCGRIRIQFCDAEGNFVPRLVSTTRRGELVYERAEPPEVIIVFMDASGQLWRTGTPMPPQRIDSPPTSLDPGGPMTK